MFETYRVIMQNRFYQELMHLISILLAVPLALAMMLLIGVWMMIKQLFVVIKWMFTKQPKPVYR